MEQLHNPQGLQGKEVVLVDVTKEMETKNGMRKVVIARRKRNGQPREAGVAVNRIDDIFRGSSVLPW